MQAQLTTSKNIFEVLPLNDLDLYMEKGDNASRVGKMEESFSWFKRGLSKARELQNQEMISKFSAIIYTLL